MDNEQATKEEAGKAQATANTNERNQSELPEVLKSRDALVKRMEKANQDGAGLIKREEDLQARNILGGQSDAGQAPVEKKPLTDIEYANAFREGKIPNPFLEMEKDAQKRGG